MTQPFNFLCGTQIWYAFWKERKTLASNRWANAHYFVTTNSLQSTTLSLHSLHCHYMSLHFTTFHYIPLHYTTFHYISLHSHYILTTTLKSSISTTRPPTSSKKILYSKNSAQIHRQNGIRRPKLVWLSGPHYPSTHDITIFRGGKPEVKVKDRDQNSSPSLDCLWIRNHTGAPLPWSIEQSPVMEYLFRKSGPVIMAATVPSIGSLLDFLL